LGSVLDCDLVEQRQHFQKPVVVISLVPVVIFLRGLTGWDHSELGSSGEDSAEDSLLASAE
jgi:hypothetical protein